MYINYFFIKLLINLDIPILDIPWERGVGGRAVWDPGGGKPYFGGGGGEGGSRGGPGGVGDPGEKVYTLSRALPWGGCKMSPICLIISGPREPQNPGGGARPGPELE